MCDTKKGMIPDECELYTIIRSFGYATSGQSEEIAEAIREELEARGFEAGSVYRKDRNE
jgi:hypothetical protein